MSDPQRFHKYDHVQVNDSRFSGEGIVIGSYADQFGGSNRTSFTVHLQKYGEVSWFYESQLTLINRDQQAILREWEAEDNAKREKESNLDWIFSHPEEALKSGYSLIALANTLGITEDDMWGKHGEFSQYFSCCLNLIEICGGFVMQMDKEGWLQHAEKLRKAKNDRT